MIGRSGSASSSSDIWHACASRKRVLQHGFYVLEGEVVFLVGTEKMHAASGVYLMVPIGVPHTFANTGNEPALFLNTFTPPHYLNSSKELSNLMSTSMPTALQMRELMAHYDTEVVGVRMG